MVKKRLIYTESQRRRRKKIGLKPTVFTKRQRRWIARQEAKGHKVIR